MPLLFQSKRLCFSCFYLFATLFLALYVTVSPSIKCLLFRVTPYDPIQSPLFSYPSSYGQHKHVLPTLRSSCSSPVFFSDYPFVFKEIKQCCQNQTDSPLRYMQGKAATFGGNFSLEKRISYFDALEQRIEFPCGFLKPFPINDYDRAEMGSCKEVVVVSAIFGDHDKIRQPKGIGSKTLDITCFIMFVDDVTLKGLINHNLISKESNEYKIGVWRLVNVSSSEGLYRNPAMNGVIPKYLVHRLFPNAKYSIWVDAKLQLVVDPLLLIHSLVIKEGVDMAVSRHPFFTNTMEEAMATTRWKKWLHIDEIQMQMETYCRNGLRPWSPSKLPYLSDVPDTALILRKHGVSSNMLSCLMFNELDAFNHRDQLAFAYVRDKLKPRIKINMFEVQVLEQVVLEYRHNLKRGGSSSTTTTTPSPSPSPSPTNKLRIKRAQPALGNDGLGNCQQYFLEMWRESHY
ncbi:alkaline ceramidase TOD1 isoform X1 [Spinacia oleracea]|uniref:Alkaline ceramidase TOD1 isoform X1 n=1 Tax=Spinacia oleracea TaxID=3562 RepID=A0A9R0JF80_SPIOL|nr:alkaline ceramidase TOD1 isoform X1 [Spinacia oleracea]XP_056693347.1 alkaline ceramidase TOD1 isoform X1 [Spinacia oleracea]XP_056693348.1 alkaline ceramidase TOD1 isoform X1 [Spinacia oleracea]XP_056693349.1 alkaline ceramidase TOD1 isoform X1 [Spinacia oleracea]